MSSKKNFTSKYIVFSEFIKVKSYKSRASCLQFIKENKYKLDKIFVLERKFYRDGSIYHIYYDKDLSPYSIYKYDSKNTRYVEVKI